MGNYSAELAAKIQAVANAGGGEVLIPVGRYLIGPGSVDVTATNVHLRGQGKGATVLTIDQMPTTRRPLLYLSGENWRISDLTVDCADFYPSIEERYAAIGGVGNGVTIHDVEIRRMGRIGILITASNNFRIENCEISLTTPTNDLSTGILIPKTESPITGGIIRGNRLVNTIIQAGGNSHWIVGNLCRGWKFGSGIFTTWGSRGMRIESNDLRGGEGQDVNGTWCLGIECWSRDSIIAYNLCYNNDGAGINTGAPHCSVIGNICFGNGHNGIAARHEGDKGGDWPQSAHNNIFVGNQSHNNAWYGYAEQRPGLVGIQHAANCYIPNGRGEKYIPQLNTNPAS